MAPSSSSAMKSTLVLMLLLSAVVASQAHQVSCTNKCNKPIMVNGIWCDPGKKVLVDVTSYLTMLVKDVTGKLLVGKYKCPADVTALDIVYLPVKACVSVKVTAVSSLLGLLHTLIGLLTSVISPCTL